jgi:hypothetical protein
MQRPLALVLGVLILLAVGDVRSAEAAYIDPNTGGMLFQILAAVFGTLSAVVLIFSSRIRMGMARLARAVRRGKGRETGSELRRDSTD